MIKHFSILIFLITLFNSCDNDPCDSGFTEVEVDNGQSVCIPDHVAGIEKGYGIGQRFFHGEYGIISWTNDGWINERGETIDLE